MAFPTLRIGRTFRHMRRYHAIVMVLMKYGFADALERFPRRLRVGSARRVPEAGGEAAKGHTRPQRVRLALQELGPTFIKLGQLLSTRPDLIPPEYARELSRLQDEVPPGDFRPIRRCVEEELGKSLGDLFKSFQVKAVAAGSIAQVHRATLHDGREVVLKIRRPDVESKLATECEMLEGLADWVGTFQADSGTVDLPRMVREFTQAVSREVDMTVERQNLLRFAGNFRDDETVHVPDVVPDLCTRSILTMEYIDGIKPTSRRKLVEAGLDPEVIAERGAAFVLRQIFDFGLFHSDPHPGNLLLLPGNIVVPLDFGQVARLRQVDRELLSDMVLAIVDRNGEQIVQACQSAEILDENTDVDWLQADAEDLIDRYRDLPLKDIPFREVISEIFHLIRKHQVRPPAQFTLMLKSLMTIESLASELDPGFDIIDSLRPYATQFRLRQLDPRQQISRLRRAVRDSVNLATRLPEDARVLLKKAKKGDFQLRVYHEHLRELTMTLDKSSNRISFSLIIAALLVASSMLTPQQGSVLGLVPLQVLGVMGYCVAAVLGLWLLISILRSRSM